MTALINRQLDLRGFHGPVPIVKTRHAIDDLRNGEVLLVTTTDRKTMHELDAWCTQTGNSLLQSSEEGGEFTFMIRKSRMLN